MPTGNPMTAAKKRRALQAATDKWAEILLPEWEITIDHQPHGPSDDLYAEITCDHIYKNACIVYYLDTCTDADLEQIALHELTHCLIAPLVAQARKTSLLNDTEESVATTITRAILRAKRKKP
jgi:hypothetical protein